MLLSLQIENFALIDQLELDFQAGLTVLTGETGAGKSIILDAIEVVLGGRVNSRMIRTGSEKAVITGRFSFNSHLEAWLQQQKIKSLENHQLTCRRELTLSGSSLRSRSKVNGILVNREFMNRLRQEWVEITAQGQTIELMIPDQQRELLDHYGGESLLQQRQQVKQSYATLQEIQHQLTARRHSQQQREQRLELIQFQLQELQTAQLTEPEELEQLEQEQERLSHVVELQQWSYQAYQLLYQNDHDTSAIADLLGDAESLVQDMVDYDAQLNSILEMVQTSLTQVVEAGQQIYRYGESLEADPERLLEIEERIRLLKTLCRKYGSTLQEVMDYSLSLETELDQLQNIDQSIAELEQQVQQFQQELTQHCQILTQLRIKAGFQFFN